MTKFPIEIKEYCLQLYLEGNNSVAEISRLASEKYGEDISSVLVNTWAHRESWKELREDNHHRAVEVIAERNLARRTRNLERDLSDLEKVREKVATEWDSLNFKDAGQASQQLQNVIEQQRKLMEGLLSATLIKTLIEIIMEEVSDVDVRNRIGQRLQNVVSQLEKVG